MTDYIEEPWAEEGPPEADTEQSLAQVLARLDAVEELAGELYVELTDHPAGGPWFWKILSPDKRKALWCELDEFVCWLQNTILCHDQNPDHHIPECWYLHPDAVEQLTAVMVAHKSAYVPKSKKTSFVLVEWFTRALWPTIDHFKEYRTFKSCQAGEHRPNTDPQLLTPKTPGFEAFITEENTQETGSGGESHG